VINSHFSEKHHLFFTDYF